MTEETRVIDVTPAQILDPGQDFQDLEFTVNMDAIDNLTVGQWVAFNDPNGDPRGFMTALERVTTGLDVPALRIKDLSLIAERIGQALEAARAPKNSGSP